MSLSGESHVDEKVHACKEVSREIVELLSSNGSGELSCDEVLNTLCQAHPNTDMRSVAEDALGAHFGEQWTIDFSPDGERRVKLIQSKYRI